MAKKVELDNRKCISSYVGDSIDSNNHHPVDVFIDIVKYKLQVRDIANNIVNDILDLNVINNNDAIIMGFASGGVSTAGVFYFNIQKDYSYVDRGIDLGISSPNTCGMSNGVTDDACVRTNSSTGNYTYTKVSISSNAVSGGSVAYGIEQRSAASNGTLDRGICIGNDSSNIYRSEYITISTKSNATQSGSSGDVSPYSYQAVSNGKLDKAFIVYTQYSATVLQCYQVTISSNSHTPVSVGTITSSISRLIGSCTSNDIYDKAIYMSLNGYVSDVITISSSSIAATINQDKYLSPSYRQFFGGNALSNQTTSNGIGDLGVSLVNTGSSTTNWIHRLRISTLGDSFTSGQGMPNPGYFSMASNGAV